MKLSTLLLINSFSSTVYVCLISISITSLSKLKIIRVVNGVYYCTCPNHQDNKPSLHVSMGNIKIILDCKAGCDYKDILEEIGMKPEQLYYNYYDKDKQQNKRMERESERYSVNIQTE